MRWQFAALPWELLGARPAMLTLTYPAEWRDCVPDARTLARHRKAFEAWWRRHYGAPVGVWVVEFQPRERRPLRQRNAPHIHIYIGLPDCVSEEEYRWLVGRKLRGEWLEKRFGRYEGRRRLGRIEGEFPDAVLAAWARIVGSGDARHVRRGVDIRPSFGNLEVAAVADRGKVADYFWRESGKWAQKSPPEDFGGLNFYGRWGSHGSAATLVDGGCV